MAGKLRNGPTLMEVAQRAGVSHQTVSRVVNGSTQVRPDTRERVQLAIDELGYQPNQAARALATQVSRLVGVVYVGGAHFGPASTVAAIEEAARAEGYATLVSVADDMDVEGLRELFRSFRGRGVDGMIVVAPHQQSANAARVAAGLVPTVVVADTSEPVPFHVVAVNQYAGALAATRHLIERGARRIAHISGPLDWYDAQARVEGWRDALREAGLDAGPLLVGDWGPERAFGLVAGLDEVPDAFNCANDLSALGAMAALRDRGLTVPADVQVTGYDDIAGAAYLTPALTTVRQPFRELGHRTMAAILNASGGEPPRVELLEPELIVRASTR